MDIKTIVLFLILTTSTLCQETENSLPSNGITDSKYFNEVVFAVIIVLLVLNYISGKGQNRKLADSILNKTLGLFFKQFAYIGANAQSTENSSLIDAIDVLEEDSAFLYRVYLTGRNNLKFAIFNIGLVRRQDFIYSNVVSLMLPEKDKVTFELALDNSEISKGILYVLKSKNFKKSAEDFIDLQSMGKKFVMENIVNKNLLIFAEASETVEIFFDKSFTELINLHGELIESIEITDCVASEFNKGNNAKLVLNLGKKTDEDFGKIALLVSEFLLAIDRYSEFVPNKKIQEVFGDNRKKLSVLREKQRKNESGETGLTWEERYAKMTPAEKKKAEEKEAKRAKAKNKMVKMVKG